VVGKVPLHAGRSRFGWRRDEWSHKHDLVCACVLCSLGLRRLVKRRLDIAHIDRELGVYKHLIIGW
jgi:hypothetical protein